MTTATILFVEDDAVIAMAVVEMLTDLGHLVIEAHSGPKALKILQDGRSVDLLLTDYAMPGMTGLELARAARELHPNLPILLATGYAELPSGDPDFPRLLKPYQQKDLASQIALSLGGPSMRD
jgi:CheY-like chemotaxis protein